MNKLLEMGRRAMFVLRVMTGYEERRIRSQRLQIQKRIEEAKLRKDAIRRIPEQIILREVRRVVEEMQTLNRSLEETEAKIDEYFKPIDKSVKTIMDMQLDKEEKSMREIAKAMHEQALLQRTATEQAAGVDTLNADRRSEGHVTCPSREQAK